MAKNKTIHVVYKEGKNENENLGSEDTYEQNANYNSSENEE